MSDYNTKFKDAYYAGQALIQLMVNVHEDGEVHLLVWKGKHMNIYQLRDDTQKMGVINSILPTLDDDTLVSMSDRIDSELANRE